MLDAWNASKQLEKSAVTTRRKIEDELITMFKVSEDLEGTFNPNVPDYSIKIIGRMNRKVDGDKIKMIAEENGISEHLSSLFSWKPSINMTAWKQSDKAITTPLLGGITTTPSRPSFTINKD